ncbi:MAG: universal stress protein [Flavobacteriales bacterium]|nr:universal stress protein [Flavobacteriales bacterium]
MKDLLATIDFSEVTPLVVETAASLGKAFGAKVWLVHVAAPDPDFVGFKVGPSYVREQRAETLRQEHQDIQAIAADLNARGIDAEARLVQGPTTDTILEMATKVEAGLIVMGSHGKSALFRAFVGSVSEQVLRDSKVPVMIIPTPRS